MFNVFVYFSKPGLDAHSVCDVVDVIVVIACGVCFGARASYRVYLCDPTAAVPSPPTTAACCGRRLIVVRSSSNSRRRRPVSESITFLLYIKYKLYYVTLIT